MKHELPNVELEGRAFLYALGVLSSDEALDFEKHLSEGCEICQAELRTQMEVSASLALTAPAMEPYAGVKENILARLESEKQVEASGQMSRREEKAQFFTLFAAEGDWKKLSEGVFVKQLYVDHQKQTVTSLYKMLPGAKAPAHKHSGVEECFVIEGDFRVNELRLSPGDYHRAEAGSVHQTLYTEKGNLLLIISPQ